MSSTDRSPSWHRPVRTIHLREVSNCWPRGLDGSECETRRHGNPYNIVAKEMGLLYSMGLGQNIESN